MPSLEQQIEEFKKGDSLSHEELLDALRVVPKNPNEPKFQKGLDLLGRWEGWGQRAAARGLVHEPQDLVVKAYPGVEKTAGFKSEYPPRRERPATTPSPNCQSQFLN